MNDPFAGETSQLTQLMGFTMMQSEVSQIVIQVHCLRHYLLM